MGKKSSSQKKKKRKRSNSCRRCRSESCSSNRSNSSSSSISLSCIDEETKNKLLNKIKKLKKKEKRKKKQKKEKEKGLKRSRKDKLRSINASQGPLPPPNSSVPKEVGRTLAPMTKEEWEKQQNTLKRVFDEETGRMRLIKGSGEIVEECVSRERHLAINKQATRGDGEFFQKKLKQTL